MSVASSAAPELILITAFHPFVHEGGEMAFLPPELAALAERVRAGELRVRLVPLDRSASLHALPDGIVLDDTQAELKGEWSHSSGFKPHIGTGYLHDDKRGDGQSIAIFRFKAPKPGKYDLRMAYSAHETRATKVPVTIESGGRKTELKVDQTQPLPEGEAFRSIGSVDLDGDTTITVRNADTEGFVILDALQLLPVP